MIQAIIFDCFGVLVTEGWYAFRDTYFPEDSPHRQQAIDAHRAADWGVISYEEFEATIADLAGISLDTVRTYLNNNATNEPLFAYIQQQLKPHYRLGMLSNAADDWLEELFSTQQRELFDAIVLSYQIKVGKPDPRAYQAIADRLGVPLEACVFIDDTERFCTAARGLGMQAILFKDFAQCKVELERILADAKQ